MANQFLIKDTMLEMRGLLASEVNALHQGIYDGVQLLGYYEKGDTPAPIVYVIGDAAVDNGYSVVNVGGISLEHDFKGHLNVLYAGAIGNNIFDNAPVLQNIFDTLAKGTIVFPEGLYSIGEGLDIKVNKEYVLKGEGRRSAGGIMGLVGIHYRGISSSYAIKLIADTAANTKARVDIRDLFLNNLSGRTDVDGLLCEQTTGSTLDNFSVRGFRDNMVISGYFFYNTITNSNFTNATRHGVNTTKALMNGTVFEKCRMSSNGGYGFNAQSGLGEVAGFIDNWIETNVLGGIYVAKALTSSITGNYFEYNTGRDIMLDNRSREGGVNSSIVVKIANNKFRTIDGTHVVECIIGGTDTLMNVILDSNVIENNGKTPTGLPSYLIKSTSNTERLSVTLINNMVVNGSGWGKTQISNRQNFNFFYNFTAIGDAFFKDLYPESRGTYFHSTSFKASSIDVLNNNYKDLDGSETVLQLNFPKKVVSDAVFAIGRTTSTTGRHLTTFEKGGVLQAQVDHNRGIVQSRTGFLFTGNDKGYYFSVVEDPNGNVVAPKGSVCISSLAVYEKATGTNALGWVKMINREDIASVSTRGIVHQSAASADLATAAPEVYSPNSGSGYTDRAKGFKKEPSNSWNISSIVERI